MEEWQKQYATSGPIGTFVFAWLWWDVSGPHALADLAGFVELGLVTFGVVAVAVEAIGESVFYSIAKHKQREKQQAQATREEEEARRRENLLQALRAAAERGETLTDLLARLESDAANGREGSVVL